MGLTRVYVIMSVILLFAVLVVGILLLREFREITTDTGRPIQIELHYPTPFPTP